LVVKAAKNPDRSMVELAGRQLAGMETSSATCPLVRSHNVESERTAQLSQTNYWNELMALRDRQREQRKTAVQVVRLSELPLESNAQGLMRWYLHPSITDTILSTLAIYRQEIPPGSRSGRLKFQGGQIMFIVEGRGHTILDGVKHAWEAGDVLNLPCKRDGIVVQHFNGDPVKPAVFLAVEPNLFAATGVDRGCGFHQLEQSPDYRPPAHAE
jgi:hypothetical protein